MPTPRCARTCSFLALPILVAATTTSADARASLARLAATSIATPLAKAELVPASCEDASATRVTASEIDAALKRGTALLLERQEAYDPVVERRERDAKRKGAREGATPDGGAKAPDPKGDAKGDAKKEAPATTSDAPARTPAVEPSEWPYEGVYRVDGEIPIGYRIGGTAIAATSLIEANATSSSGAVELDARTRAAVTRALEFVLAGLEHPLMTAEFDKGYDVRGWGHAYALDFLLELRRRALVPQVRAKDVDVAIAKLVAMLAKTEIETGGWNYSRPSGSKLAVAEPASPDGAKDDAKKARAPQGPSAPSTFMTAPTLQILFEAARQGEAVDAGVVERALKSLEDARLDTGSFQYGTNPARKSGKGIEEVPGAVGRMPVCETTLYLAGRGSIDRIRASVDAFFEHWQWLEDRRKKTGTHEGPYKIAPYFFYYAHRYAAQAIEFLPEKERAEYREKLHALLWKVREDDGGWNDRIFPRSEGFGTAMTLLALREPASERPAAWKAPIAK